MVVAGFLRRVNLSQREFARARRLKETGAIALQSDDLAMNRVEVLEDQLASAKFALKVAEYEVSIGQWGGAVPLRGKVALVEPGAFLKVSALGVEEQRVKMRVSFLDLTETTFGDRYRVEARITTWSAENVLQITTAALFRRGNEWMTFVVVRGKPNSPRSKSNTTTVRPSK